MSYQGACTFDVLMYMNHCRSEGIPMWSRHGVVYGLDLYGE